METGDAYIYVGTVVGLQNCRNLRKSLKDHAEAEKPTGDSMINNKIYHLMDFEGDISVSDAGARGPFLPWFLRRLTKHDSN